MTDLEALIERMKEAAGKATRGPWHRAELDRFATLVANESENTIVVVPWNRLVDGNAHMDAEHIALCSPDNILTLIRYAERVPVLVEALEQAEACMSIVEPRSDKAEYLRILGVIRAALKGEQE